MNTEQPLPCDYCTVQPTAELGVIFDAQTCKQPGREVELTRYRQRSGDPPYTIHAVRCDEHATL